MGALRDGFARQIARRRLRGCDRVGEGPRLEGAPWVANAGRLTIGRRLFLSSWPVQSHLVVARGAELEIGDEVSIAHGAAVAAHERIRIGDRTRIGPFASISDTDFHVAGRRHAAPETSQVVIGRGVRLGTRVTVLRGASIGDGAIVASGSVVSGAISAGARVAGVPARSHRGSGDARRDALPAIDRVPAIFAAALGLPQVPDLGARREDFAAWDSLGSLQVLLALEEAFALTLDEGAVAGAGGLSELAGLVEAAVERGSTQEVGSSRSMAD
jgi:acetyltransferase-like isoleucine patch superfamily enzyme/acyl carrier protein